MATGNPTGITGPGVHNANSGTNVTSLAINSASPIAAFRLAFVVSGSTTGAVTGPSGWTRVYENTSYGFKFGIWYHPRWDTSDTTTQPKWTFGTSNTALVVSNAWTGVDPDTPFVLPPSASTAAGSTSTATSFTAPTLAPSHNCGVGVWFWVTKLASSGAATLTRPSDLTGMGTTGSTTAASFSATSGGWAINAAPYTGLMTPTPTGTKVTTSSKAGAWAAVGMVLAPANNGSGMLSWFDGMHHHDEPRDQLAVRRNRIIVPDRRLHIVGKAA